MKAPDNFQLCFFHRGRISTLRRLLSGLLLGCGLASIALMSFAAETTPPYPRISEEAFRARLPFFDYDTGVPLEGRVVREWDESGGKRQKIVFRGAQGFLVPGYVEFPKKGQKPWPLVLLLHG